MSGTITEGFAQTIISAETNPIRFERFCIAVCERSEQMTFMPTSYNYDQARDAKSIAPSKRSHRALLSATLNQQLDAKVGADLAKLALTSTPEHLLYCCSQALTEYRIDNEIVPLLRNYFPDASVSVLGAVQLGVLADRYSDIFREYYSAELELIRSKLFSFQAGPESTETRGLRLALIAFGSEDAVSLRRDISTRAVLEILLSHGKQASEAEIAEHLSVDLRLPKILDVRYIRNVLTYMKEAGLARQVHGQWVLTPDGETQATAVPKQAAEVLLGGRALIRTAIQDGIGQSLADSQFESLWTTLLDFLAELFYSNGIAVVSAINEFIGATTNEVGGPAATSLEKLVEEAAGRIGARISIRDLSVDVEQAVRDIFTERSGPAFEWLTQVCERFVALCALGLETSSAAEIRAALLRYELVLDSDVLLTILCAGEPHYQATRELLSRFRQLGGMLLVSPPILEEVAYHAHISEADFRGTYNLLGKLRRDELTRYTENAFVRAFHTLTADSRKWSFYRSQFVGKSPRDYSSIFAILRDELLVQLLPAKFDDEFARRISDYVRSLAEQVGKPEVLYDADVGRLGRDGQVLASIAAARNSYQNAGSAKIVTLLSSSSRLRRANKRFKTELGEPDGVMPVRALAYMLSLVPDVGLGAATLRQALFNFGETAHLTDVQRRALRIIRASAEFDLPWAKRRRLQDELDSVIRRDADHLGVRQEVLKGKFSAGDEAARPGEVIVTALQRMGIRDRQGRELIDIQRRVRRLDEENTALREALARYQRSRSSTKTRAKTDVTSDELDEV